MNERSRSRRDFIQNITIAVLAVSAVLLFAQTQAYNLGASSSLSRLFSGPEVQSSAVIAPRQDDFSHGAPVRVAVASTYGRFGDVAMTSADEEFLPLGQLLAQALGSSQSLTFSSSPAFRDALDHTSVYYDFLTPLPLSILADLAQTTMSENTVFARRLVLAEEHGAVTLHLWAGDNRYYRSATALSPEDLNTVVSQYELGNAFFAFEGTGDQALSPYSLLSQETPQLPQLAAVSSLSDTTRLMASLRFNPNTQNRYWESDTTEVISESNGRTLRLSTDGTVDYQSGNDATLSITAEGEIPSMVEAATEVRLLLNELFAPTMGDASLYLEQIRQTGAETRLCFGYQSGGVPIRFADGGCAADVTLSGTAVTSMELRLRQYAVSETPSLLLPLRQTLAIAPEGAELSIGYVDNGGDPIGAAWLSD